MPLLTDCALYLCPGHDEKLSEVMPTLVRTAINKEKNAPKNKMCKKLLYKHDLQSVIGEETLTAIADNQFN